MLLFLSATHACALIVYLIKSFICMYLSWVLYRMSEGTNFRKIWIWQVFCLTINVCENIHISPWNKAYMMIPRKSQIDNDADLFSIWMLLGATLACWFIRCFISPDFRSFYIYILYIHVSKDIVMSLRKCRQIDNDADFPSLNAFNHPSHMCLDDIFYKINGLILLYDYPLSEGSEDIMVPS